MQMDLLLAADCSSPPAKSPNGPTHDGRFGKMFPAHLAPKEGGTLLRWLESYLGPKLVFLETAGQTPVWRSGEKDSSNGSFWMRNSCEHNPTLAPSLKDEGVCSLSEILETGKVAPRYFLSPLACAGILRRSEKRGKELPEALKSALIAVASQTFAQPSTPDAKTGQSETSSGGASLKSQKSADASVTAPTTGGGLTDRTLTPGESSLLAPEPFCAGTGQAGTGQAGTEILQGLCPTLNCNHEQPYIAAVNSGHGFWKESDAAQTLGCEARAVHESTLIAGPVAHALTGNGHDASEDGAQFEGPHETANIRAANGGSSRSYVQERMAVRRLTPLECERLQGFPDGWTDIPIKGKRAKDGPRYKALGNSMAVNVMRLIGERIAEASK